MSKPPLSPQQFTWDIDYATNKDTLKQGELKAGTHRVTTQGKNKLDSRLAAEQMVFATGHEPTQTREAPRER